MSTKPLKILVVDDSVVFRRLLMDILARQPDVEAVTTATGGRVALAKIEQFEPNLVTLDVEMPDMDGIETLRQIRRLRPELPVFMVSSLTERGASVTLDALTQGAVDYITKPTAGDLPGFEAALMAKLRSSPRARGHRPTASPSAPILAPAGARGTAKYPAVVLSGPHPSIRPLSEGGPIELVAIGVSTGGPNALATLLAGLPRDLPPVVIAQHMPPMFTRLLAERLDRIGTLSVKEAADGDVLQPGCAYIAPGDHHLIVRGPRLRPVLGITDGPPENSCRPAVDVLFRSVASVYGPSALALVLTGMGQDGLRGSDHIVAAGGHVVVQDEATSVVWGMPGYVANAGLAQAVLPLENLAPYVVARVNRARGARPRPRGLVEVQ